VSADDTYDEQVSRRYANGGYLPSHPADDSIPVLLSEGKVITDPDEAEALGLTVEADHLRREGGADLSSWPLEMLDAINDTGIWPQFGDCE
jgi:hypothetical protein